MSDYIKVVLNRVIDKKENKIKYKFKKEKYNKY